MTTYLYAITKLTNIVCNLVVIVANNQSHFVLVLLIYVGYKENKKENKKMRLQHQAKFILFF